MAAVACDSGNGDASGPALELDERQGTVEGVGLGDGAAEIKEVFGEAPPYDIYANSTPLGVHPTDLTHAGHGGCRPRGRENALRYRGVSFFAYGNKFCDVAVTSERAVTRLGLSPGDRLSRVEDLYPELECGKTNISSDGTSYEPACWGRTGKRTYMWVGGDPINNLSFGDRPYGPRP